MKKTMLLLLLITVLACGTEGPARASLVSRDLVAGSGDGLLTFDPMTGLEWLDLTATKSHSYAEIMNDFGGYLTVHGFRYADANDLWLLYPHAGIDFLGRPVDYSTHAAFYYGRNEEGVKNLLLLMSPTISSGPFQEAVGMYVLYDDDGNFLQLKAASVHLNEAASESWVTISDTPYSPSLTASSPLYAAYLVRDALPVPLPAAFIPLAAGIGVLLGVKRRLAGS